MADKCGVGRSLKSKVKAKLQHHSSIATIIPYIPFLFHLDAIKIDSHSNIRAIWWNRDLILWPMILKSLFSWDRFLKCIAWKSDFDIILNSQDIGLKTCSLSNRLLNIDTEGNDQCLTVTSSAYATREPKASDNQEQVTSSLQDVRPGRHLNIKTPSYLFYVGCNYISMPYMCTACISNYIPAILWGCDYIWYLCLYIKINDLLHVILAIRFDSIWMWNN